MSHTKGPWAPAHYSATPTMLERLTTRTQAAVCMNLSPMCRDEMLVAICGDADDPQSEADARLIAAAPEMYQLMKDLISRPSIHDEVFGLMDRARVLIGKIKGGER